MKAYDFGPKKMTGLLIEPEDLARLPKLKLQLREWITGRLELEERWLDILTERARQNEEAGKTGAKYNRKRLERLTERRERVEALRAMKKEFKKAFIIKTKQKHDETENLFTHEN